MLKLITTLQNHNQPHLKRLSFLKTTLLVLLVITSGPLKAQADDIAKAQQQAQEAQEAYKTLKQLLESKEQQNQLIKTLKNNLTSAKESVTKAELEKELNSENEKLTDLENQISTITSGTSKQTFYASENKKFNLEEELQSLAEPFIKLIKSTTQNIREIDALKTRITETKKRQSLSKEALKRLNLIINSTPVVKGQKPGPADKFLLAQKKQWQERLKEAETLEDTSNKQLEIKQNIAKSLQIENYATTFIRTRGINIIIALFTFFATFAFLRLLFKAMGMLYSKSGIKRGLYARLAKLIFEILTVLIAIIMTMTVLNYLNDWVLLGVSALFALALAWLSVKVLPVIIEQAVLLLNLGAVQEGERLMIDGVPWKVTKLDHYTHFENPALEGGHFTLPVRELRGMHSRPPASNEAWFPTKKDDWVQLENGHIAKVLSQTPELVQLVELGGARIIYSTQDFINATLRNLSTGFRIRQTFGISYKHQAQSTYDLPPKLTQFVKERLETYIPPQSIKHIIVDIMAANSSSIDYDIEIDISGDQAHRFEDIEGEVNRLMIEACNIYELEIPFPQMVIHQPQ